MMEREIFILAAMSPAGSNSFSPVQVQKLFFLLDEHVAKQTGEPYFDFQPYDYGPFDKDVYIELDQLETKGFVEITSPSNRGMRTYRLTNEGQQVGSDASGQFPDHIQQYIGAAVNFVRSLSFADLVSAIYKAYPRMQVNSVFVEETK